MAAHAVVWGLAGLALSGSFEWPAREAGAPAELGARDDGARLRAVLALAAADEPRARALLVPVLQDRNVAVRVTAARLLARRGAPEALEAATTWLATTAPGVRLSGLQVLRDVDALPPAARRAVERATRDGDLATRVQALDVLARHEPAASFGAVLAALGDEHRDVRARAARVLAETRDARAALPLVARLEDGDRQVRVEALAALGALGAAGERRVVPALLRQLQSDDATPDLRLPAIDALGAAADPAAVTALRGLARRRPRDELARRAVFALGRIATPEALETLGALLHEPEAISDAREALALAGPRARPLLERELARGAPLAAELLGGLGDRRATPALVAAVDGRGPAATAACRALASLGDDAAVPALVRAASSGDAERRVAALEGLAALRDDRAAEFVARVLAEPDAATSVEVRAAAVKAAGACGGPALAPAIAARLLDPGVGVRRAAALALARVAGPSPGVARAIVAALEAALPRGEAELEALGDALERAAGTGEAALLERVYLGGTGPARAPLARALAAVLVDGAPASPRLIDALVGELAVDGPRGPSAADALSAARPDGARQEALRVAFARADDGVAARLAPALARFQAGARQLAATLRDERAGPTRRAAAAWALGGVPEAGEALRAALSASEPAVAANARAALVLAARGAARGATAIASPSSSSWAAVRLVTGDGAPWPRRWLVVTAPDLPAVWTMTDLGGRARLVVPTSAAGVPTVSVPPSPAE